MTQVPSHHTHVRSLIWHGAVVIACVSMLGAAVRATTAGELTVRLTRAPARVTLVGAIDRWDSDGNPRRPVDPKARIGAPVVSAKAVAAGGDIWRFENLPAGRYDLVILLEGNTRLEGFLYPPVLEFDPFVKQVGGPPEDVARLVTQDIAKSKHYENKVRPLFLEGNDKGVRVLMQLLRDEATSFDADFGEPVATLRYEVWQYHNRYGGWTKEKRTRVLHRVLLGKRELQTWTWLWDPRLGGVEIKDQPVRFDYEFPSPLAEGQLRGLVRGNAGGAKQP